MKKLFLLGIFIICLTGCSAEYVININNNSVTEKVVINNFVDTSGMSIDFKSFYVPIDYEIDDYEIFTKKMNDIEYYNFVKKADLLKFNYTFDKDSFGKSTFFNQCYENVTFTVDAYELLLKANGKFLCFDKFKNLDEIKVVVKSEYKLLETNADTVKDGVYEWIIDNSNNREILLRLDSSYENNKKELSLFEKNSIFFVFLSIILCCGVIVLIVRTKSNLKNKI